MSSARVDVLVIDDDWMNCELLQLYLQHAGYTVRLETSGEDGLQAAADDQPAVIMLDVQLPGIDGLEVCRRIKRSERTRDSAVLMITAFESETDRLSALEAGADGFVCKPFRMGDLLEQVSALIAR